MVSKVFYIENLQNYYFISSKTFIVYECMQKIRRANLANTPKPTGINFMTYKSVNKQKFMMKIFFEPRLLRTSQGSPGK